MMVPPWPQLFREPPRLRTPTYVLLLFISVACHPEVISITDGYYEPKWTVPNAECYDRVWDFNRGVTVFNQESSVLSIDVWDDRSGAFPGTLGFYPCELADVSFNCTADTATYPDPASCEDRSAEEIDLFTAEGTWTSSTAFDVTFTYRRAIVWEDGTDSTCPDVCTSVWDLSEVLSAAL